MPIKLIAKQRASRVAKERRAAQLTQMARAGTLQLPARVEQYIASSTAKHEAAEAGLAEEERKLECVRADYAGN
eukprot:5809804-Prymnesium_polylepis.1